MKKINEIDRVYKIDAVIIVLTIVSLVAVGGYVSPLVIAPLDKFETTNTDILFSIEKADVLLIDDNIEFNSPEEYSVEEGQKIELRPGTYYWKGVGIVSSEVRTLTIKSLVSLELQENSDDEFDVVNAGNVALDVEIYDGEELIESVKLGVGEEIESSREDNESKLIGRYDE